MFVANQKFSLDHQCKMQNNLSPAMKIKNLASVIAGKMLIIAVN